MGGKKKEDQEDWEPRYGNDSRPWLLGFSQSEPPATSTTTKETFTADWPPSPPKEGVRRQLLRKALWDEVRREVAAELSHSDETPSGGTEYTESYVKEGFTSCPIKTDPDLHRQYPLYGGGVGAGGLSLWRERFPQLEGTTHSAYIAHPFHRCTAFTKPLNETFEDTIQPR